MVKILNKSLQLQAVLNNLISPLITERLDQTEKTFKFTTVIDEEKSQYVQYGNIVDVEDDYFSIITTTENHNSDDTLTIAADCEHVSYSLSNEEHILDYFTAYGTPAEILTQLLQGTAFAVGTVEFTQPIAVAINEKVTRRGAILTIANQIGAEILFKKYQVSLLTRRGANRGVQFRYGKNIIGLSRKVDGTKIVSGLPTISYEVSVPMLESLPEYADLEHVELGDDIRVFDDKLKIDVLQRVVSIAYDPVERINLNVQISNCIEDIANTITRLMQKTVVKDRIYNGCKIGPKSGFEAIRSDNKVRTVMNATEGISIEQGDGTGSNWVKVFFVDENGNQTMDGRLKITQDGKILLEAFKDIFGGVVKIYDANGMLNAKIGVEGGTGDNVGGTLILYDDVPNGADPSFYQRVEAGILATNRAGAINLRTIDDVSRLRMKANDGSDANDTVPSILFWGDLSSSYISSKGGYIANETIATQPWVQSMFEPKITGASGSFTTADGKTITVSNGIITSIV